MTASDPPVPVRGDTSRQAYGLEAPGSPYIQSAANAASNGCATTGLASPDRPMPPKTKNEMRQIEYIRKLSLQRQKQVLMMCNRHSLVLADLSAVHQTTGIPEEERWPADGTTRGRARQNLSHATERARSSFAKSTRAVANKKTGTQLVCASGFHHAATTHHSRSLQATALFQHLTHQCTGPFRFASLRETIISGQGSRRRGFSSELAQGLSQVHGTPAGVHALAKSQTAFGADLKWCSDKGRPQAAVCPSLWRLHDLHHRHNIFHDSLCAPCWLHRGTDPAAYVNLTACRSLL